MSLISESSCASTIKEFGATPKLSNGSGGSGNKIKGFSPANSISPSAAYQSGWNPAPSTAQQIWAAGNPRPGGPGSMISDDSQSIISMSSSISQQHLKIAREKMAKRQQKKLSKSAHSTSARTQSSQNHSGGSSNSSDPNNLSNRKHKKDKSSYSDGNKSGIAGQIGKIDPLNLSQLKNNNKENIGNLINDNQSELSFASTISTNSKKLLPQNKPLGYQPPEITASRLSFQYAMANPMPSPMATAPQIEGQNQNYQPMKLQASKSVGNSMLPPSSIPNRNANMNMNYNTMSTPNNQNNNINGLNLQNTTNSLSNSKGPSSYAMPHLTPMTSGNPLHVDMPNPPSIESLKKLSKQKSSSGQGIQVMAQHIGLPRQSTVNNIVQ